MKRSELKVGDRLYYASPSDWSYHQGNEVVVLAVDPYRETSPDFSRERRYTLVKSGNGVLVTLLRPGLSDRKTVVQLGHLRGPYEQTKAEVEARRAAAVAARKEEQRHRDETSRNTSAAVSRAIDAGYTDVSMRYDHPGKISMSVQTLIDLLDAAGH